MSKGVHLILLIGAVLVISGAIWWFEAQKLTPMPGAGDVNPSSIPMISNQDKENKYERAKEIVQPAGFINIDKISVGELIGKKVILVDFWTYSCINCQRTLPYLNAWHDKYNDQGLVILGVHTPEFEFEKNYDNVARAVEQYNIKYPVILDSDYATWHAYRNRYWPRKYLIDIDGYIVYDHIGEGAYEETEKKIQELLAERMQKVGEDQLIDQSIVHPPGEVQSETGSPHSPEIYFGAARNLYLGNGQAEQVGTQNLRQPEGIKTNILYLDGTWDFQPEFAENVSANAKIIFRYQGKQVHFVASAAQPVSVMVLKDGHKLSPVTIQADQLYTLINDPQTGEHTLELMISQPGLKAFTFTFG